MDFLLEARRNRHERCADFVVSIPFQCRAVFCSSPLAVKVHSMVLWGLSERVYHGFHGIVSAKGCGVISDVYKGHLAIAGFFTPVEHRPRTSNVRNVTWGQPGANTYPTSAPPAGSARLGFTCGGMRLLVNTQRFALNTVPDVGSGPNLAQAAKWV